MRRQIRTRFFIFLSIFCFGFASTVLFFTRKPVMLSTELSQEINRGSSILALNAEKQRPADSVDTVRVVMCDNGAKLRNSSDPVEFRKFKNNDDHLLYLYDRLLTSIPWEPNPWNLAEFREKLMNHTNMTFQEGFVLTHDNAREGDSLPYAVTNSKSNKTKSYKLSKRFITENVLPVSPLTGKRFKRCSVVGNSGILSNSKCGEEIDQSDYVLRSNLPPIRPHAADAGWKTNLTTMNPSIIGKRYKSLKTKNATDAFVKAVRDFHGVLWLPCLINSPPVGICLKAKHTLDSYGVRNPESTIANPIHFGAVNDFWKNRTITGILSTGFYITQLSLTMCEETHLYGFWPFPYRVPAKVTDTGISTMRKVNYHYFDKIGLSKVHSMNDEFSVLLQMHVLGLLQLHVRDCDV